MFRNYCINAYRNLVKNKFHSLINIGGLTIGFTIGITVLLVVYNQFSYDRFHKNQKTLYQAYQVFNLPEGASVENTFGYGQGPVYKSQATTIARLSRLVDGGNHIEYKGVDKQIPVSLVDEDFLQMFTFRILAGNRTHPLKNVSDVVVTEEAAKKLFGNEDPIGKTITATVGDKRALLTVSALVENFVNSSIHFQVLARIENRASYATDRLNWDNRAPALYVQLKEGALPAQAEAQLKQLDKKYVPNWYPDLASKGVKPDKNGDLFATHLLPLNQLHFSTRVNGHHAVSYTQMATIGLVGLFILFIACFNFVNISLANGFARSREIGVRKCLGAPTLKLFAQFWIEGFLICAVAFGCSLILVNGLLRTISGLEEARGALLQDLWKPGFLALAGVLLLFISLMAGGYPAWMVMRFNVIESLKGTLHGSRKSGVRNGLIVTQFAIACLMISCTYIIYRQYQYLQNADLGMDKAYVISVPFHQPEKGHELIRQLRLRLSGDPRILSISGSDINLGRGADHRTSKTSIGFSYEGRTLHSNTASVDYDYLKTLGVRPLAGRDFDQMHANDTSNCIVISQSLATDLNDPHLIGKRLAADSTFAGWEVIGIFPDFHLYSMEEALEPLMLTLSPGAPLHYCFIKTTAASPVTALAMIKKQMSQLEPGQDFAGTFVDDNVSSWYQGEKAMSILFSIAATVSILLSCFGLLAMVLLIIQQRIKEIGVRKVLGATVQSIFVLVAKDFIRLVLLAVLIAIPIAWFAMYQWLNNFPYRIPIQLSMFVLVAGVAIFFALVTISVHTVRAARQNPVKNLRTD